MPAQAAAEHKGPFEIDPQALFGLLETAETKGFRGDVAREGSGFDSGCRQAYPVDGNGIPDFNTREDFLGRNRYHGAFMNETNLPDRTDFFNYSGKHGSASWTEMFEL